MRITPLLVGGGGEQNRLNDDSKQLYVVPPLENYSLQGPGTVRRLYDLLGSTTPQSSSPK